MLAGSCGDKSMWWALLLRRAVSLAAVWQIWTHPSPQLSLVGGTITVKRNPHGSTFSSILASFNCLSVYRSKSTNIKCLWRILFFHFIYLFIWRLSTLQYCIGFVLKENNQAKRKSLPSINVWPNWRWKDERIIVWKIIQAQYISLKHKKKSRSL